jgi:hypothetical protein
VNIRAARPDAVARWPLYLGLVALVILAVVATGIWRERNAPAAPFAQPAPPALVAEAPAGPQEIEREEDEPSGLQADAFEAVTGHRRSFDIKKDGETIGISPQGILELPFGKVLVTGEQIELGCHYCQGSYGIYYFREEAGKVVITGRWPEAILGADWGDPPEWRLTSRFTSFPAIVAWGDFMQHGIIIRSSTLTELRPEGPVMSDAIGMGFDDRNFQEDPRRACTVTGRVMNVRKDVGFDVEVTGTVRKIERYRKSGGRFVSISPIDWQEPCRS